MVIEFGLHLSPDLEIQKEKITEETHNHIDLTLNSDSLSKSSC